MVTKYSIGTIIDNNNNYNSLFVLFLTTLGMITSIGTTIDNNNYNKAYGQYMPGTPGPDIQHGTPSPDTNDKSFVTYSKASENDLAVVSMTMPSKVSSNQPLDLELQILPVDNNSILENSTSVPYEVTIEQRGKVIYHFAGFTEDYLGLISPEFLKGGPAVITINLISLQSVSVPQLELASVNQQVIPGLAVIADKVIFTLDANNITA